MSPLNGSVDSLAPGHTHRSPISSHAVKALIHDDSGRLLLQHRDDRPDLPFPGCWTFFGGLVEPGENWAEALRRELVEELGCCPGRVEKELFSWAWDGEDPALNHVFPVRLVVKPSRLDLREGQAMGWFSWPDLTSLKTTPLITDNLEQLFRFLTTVGPSPRPRTRPTA